MNHLNDLLDDISSDPPTDHLDLDDVIGAARSRVRRRRVVTGIAAAAVVGLGAAFVLPGGGSEPAPAGPPQVSVLTLDDAVEADPSSDYRVLKTFTAHSTDEAVTGDFVRGVLADGTVVLQRYPNGWNGRTDVVLVGPDNTSVVRMPSRYGNYLGATEHELVFGGIEDMPLLLIDLQDFRVRGVLKEPRLLDLNQPAQTLSGSDGHVVIGGARFGDAKDRPIYDVDLGTGDLSKIAQGGDVAAYDGRVAWTDAHDAAVQTVTVRNQAGGTTSFDPNTGDCVGKGIGITDQRVVLMTNCDNGAGDDEYNDAVTRVDVFDLEGNPLTRIVGDEMGPVRMADRFLTLSAGGGEQQGTYTYDLETERFLRVTDEMSGLAGYETGIGSTVVWEEWLDGEGGATYVVAEMR